MTVGFVSYAAIVELDASTASYSGSSSSSSSSIPASEPLPSPAMNVHDGLGWSGMIGMEFPVGVSPPPHAASD